MPLQTTLVTGYLYAPDGSPLANTPVSIRLTRPDTDENIVVPEIINATTDAGGLLNVPLWPNTRGVSGSQYRLTVKAWMGAGERRLVDRLLTVPDTGTAELTSILDAEAPDTVSTSAAIRAADEAQQSLLDAEAARTAAELARDAAQAAQAAAGNALAGTVDAAALAALDAQAAAASAAGAAIDAASAESSAALALAAADTVQDVAADAAAATAAAATATTQAGIATTQAGIATTAATTATTQAGVASAAATTATTQAGIATTAATTATTQAGIATTAAATATTQAGIATTAATTATTQAGIATTQAGIATAAAAAASADAISADLSAAQAANSASTALTASTIAVSAANYKGDYDPMVTYQVGDSVTYMGSNYAAKTVNTGVTPVDGPNWLLLSTAEATVNSVFGRTGNVIAQSADYAAFYTPLSHVGSGGAQHALATTTVAGFMSGADKTKIDGIEPGAQANTVTSVFGRTGAIVAQQADYDAFFTTPAEAAAAAPVQTVDAGMGISVNQTTGNVVVTNADRGTTAVAAHEAAADPHPQYTTAAEAAAAAPVQSFNGRTGAVMPQQADYDAFFTTPMEAAAAAPVQSVLAGMGISVDMTTGNVTVTNADRGTTAVTAHEAAADPHPQYTTTAEASAAAPVQSVNGETGALTGYVKTTGAQTLDSKTMSEFKRAGLSTVSGQTTLDLTAASYFVHTATANTTFVFNNPPASGQAQVFVLRLTNGGAFTITWPATVDWPGGIAPTLTASGVDILVFVTDNGGGIYHGQLARKDSR